MSCTRTLGANALLSKQPASHLLKALNSSLAASSPSSSLSYGTLVILRHPSPSRRQFSTTNRHPFKFTNPAPIREFFPVTHTEQIRRTPAAWSHPIYTEAEVNSVVVAHRNAKTWSDYIALGALRTTRWCFDLVSGYRHDKAVALHDKSPAAAQQKFAMTERKYMIRNIFLESVAGVPGMVAGMLRHLRSMRRMKRDNGWMETLLEESYNERMHLLTFLQMAEPGWFMRLAVLGAQGVFFNAFFLAYLVSPSTCHRFVGYLEEEAVLTYTREINDIDAGKLPLWEKMEAPPIAIEYWKMPEGKRTMRDLLLYVRADESKHREVNHTLANIDYKEDPNPYSSTYKSDDRPHPNKGIQHQRPGGWERDEVI